VINKNPAYRRRVKEKLVVLLGGERKSAFAVELFQMENVNLIGAALAALI
jgi:hexokinase